MLNIASKKLIIAVLTSLFATGIFSAPVAFAGDHNMQKSDSNMMKKECKGGLCTDNSDLPKQRR